jgi:rfaE bifunctional protein nucleotidyltransferase chain/domain
VSSKLKTVRELQEIVTRAKIEGKKIVFTNGCFDMIHRGHLHLLREARAFGEMLIVGLNTDRSVRSIKGSDRPVIPESDRGELLAAMEMVDYVVLFDEPDPSNLIAALRPDVLVKGGDWGEDQVVGSDIVTRDGGEVKIVPYLKGFSTTAVIAKIRS